MPSVAASEDADLLFISWAPYCSRSDSIAKRLGGESYMVYSPLWGSRYSTIAFKYLSQSLKTFWLLLRKRPRVVLVMVPPVVACLPVWMYCLLSGARFTIDAHTGAFLNRRWRRFQFLQRFVSRRAATTIVTSEYLAEMVQDWGGHASIIRDVPVCFADPQPVELPPGCNMTFVSSFCYDEPIEELLKAAAQLPNVQFHVTGDDSRLAPHLRALAPENVRFTGFLSEGEYIGQLLASDAVIALTTNDHTMQRGAYEAVYLARPVVTSDFPLLRKAFPKGAVHVQPTAPAIRRGIEDLRANREQYVREVLELRTHSFAKWADAAEGLLSRLSEGAQAEPFASRGTVVLAADERQASS